MKRLKTVTAAVLACATMLAFTGCGGFKVISDEDIFYDALDNAVSIDKDETTYEKNTKLNGDKVEYLIYTKDGDNIYTYIRFKKADDAMDKFDEFYEDFEEAKNDNAFEGSSTMTETKTRGSVIFSGEAEADTALSFFHMNQYFFEDSEIFGGVYVNDNVYIEAYSVNGSKRDREKITRFLNELGFPKP